MKAFIVLFTVFYVGISYAQGPYAPAAGMSGTSAISWDDEKIIAWASGITVERGFKDISNQSSGNATHGEDEWALGVSDLAAISLGDGGTAILTFNHPIVNLDGPDFAIFENSFSDTFLELAFVEVSSDGIQYFRFPNHSLTPFSVQVDAFGSLDPTDLNGFAGKYRAEFGTPFDLEELKDSTGLDVNNVTHVKIIDVVGSINETYASKDSQDNVINDPWPTDFESGGFDLDAVGVLNNQYTTVEDAVTSTFRMYPNPAQDVLFISNYTKDVNSIEIYSLTGIKVHSIPVLNGSTAISVENLHPGFYWVRLIGSKNYSAKKICVQR